MDGIRHSSSDRRKVVLVEFNEITWRLIDPFIAKGVLPTFGQFVREGARGTAVADENPPYLDPWISWTTVYTGRPQSEHGVKFMEQPPETVKGPRVWEVALDAGRSIGLYGSLLSWPPRQNVRGFWVPGTFSPGPETFPPELQPIQDLNLTQTRAHNPIDAKSGKKSGSLQQLMTLRKLGLRVSTAAKLASFLLRTRFKRHRKWEKVSLQPLVNLDFFEKLYGAHQPDFSTFHSNHVAHYMHRYWRAMDPAPYRVKPSAAEVKHFGPAIEFGYRIADRVLGRIWRLADENTVVVVASALGHQPYLVEKYEARKVVRVKDIRQITDLCGVTGQCNACSMMAPEWNLEFKDDSTRKEAEGVLNAAWVRTLDTKLFSTSTMGNTVNVAFDQQNLHGASPDIECVFPQSASGPRRFKLSEIAVADDETPKEGYHDKPGVLLMRGAGIRRGASIGDCTTLDIAPTILHLLGIPTPSHMKGRVLSEALTDGADGASGTVVEQSHPVGAVA